MEEKFQHIEKPKAIRKLSFELSELESKLSCETFSERQIRRLFKIAEEQLKSGTLANRWAIIDQYINKVLVFPDKIEVYLNLTSDYTIK